MKSIYKVFSLQSKLFILGLLYGICFYLVTNNNIPFLFVVLILSCRLISWWIDIPSKLRDANTEGASSLFAFIITISVTMIIFWVNAFRKVGVSGKYTMMLYVALVLLGVLSFRRWSFKLRMNKAR